MKTKQVIVALSAVSVVGVISHASIKYNGQMYAVDSLRNKTTNDMKVEKILEIIKAYHETLEDGSNVVPMYNWNAMAVDLYQLASESNDIQNVSKHFSQEDMTKEYARGFNACYNKISN